MPLRRIKRMNQTADLQGTISQSWKKGHTVQGAITQASLRYPDLPIGTIAKIAHSAYNNKTALQDIFSGNLTQFANLQNLFNCPSGKISFNLSLQFVNEKTGQVKEWGTQLIAVIGKKPQSLATLLYVVIDNVLAVIESWNYKVKPFDPNATAAEFIYGSNGLFNGSALEIHSYECL